MTTVTRPRLRRAVLRARMAPAEDDDRAVTVTCSTQTLGRDKIILVSSGIDLQHFRSNPIWLWQHNADWPVARSDRIDVQGTNLVSRVRFPPAGVSERADEVLGLIRAGVINAASTGFEKVQAELIDAADPAAGTRIISCELAEMSFVSVPAVPDALVTERANRQENNMQLTAVHRALARQYERELGGRSPAKPGKPPVKSHRKARHASWFYRAEAARYAAELRRGSR